MNRLSLIATSIFFLIAFAESCRSACADGGLTPQQKVYVDSVAQGGSGAGWPGLTSMQLSALAAKADEYLSDYQTHHLPNGLNADVWFTDFSRAQVATFPVPGYLGLGDSATFTGHYLGMTQK